MKKFITLILIICAFQAQSQWVVKSYPWQFPSIRTTDSLIVRTSSGDLLTRIDPTLGMFSYIGVAAVINDSINGVYANYNFPSVKQAWFNHWDKSFYSQRRVPSIVNSNNSSGEIVISGGSSQLGGSIHLSGGGVSEDEGYIPKGIAFYTGRNKTEPLDSLTDFPKLRGYVTAKGTWVLADTIQIKSINNGGESDTTLKLAVYGNSIVEGSLKVSSPVKDYFLVNPSTNAVDFYNLNASLSGTALTDGQALVSDGDSLLAQQVAITITHTESIDFPSIAAGSTTDQSFTLTGINEGDIICLTPNKGAFASNLIFQAWCNGANTVVIRASNFTASAIDISEAEFYIKVIKA